MNSTILDKTILATLLVVEPNLRLVILATTCYSSTSRTFIRVQEAAINFMRDPIIVGVTHKLKPPNLRIVALPTASHKLIVTGFMCIHVFAPILDMKFRNPALGK
jgi:hypothetical protein